MTGLHDAGDPASMDHVARFELAGPSGARALHIHAHDRGEAEVESLEQDLSLLG
jgi:hypothetical protein